MRTISLFVGLLALVAAQPTKEQFINDLNTLNYALALENFESVLYSTYLQKFPNAAAANVSTQFYTYLTQAGSSESNHASTLKTVIESFKWPAAPACDFTAALAGLGNDPATWLETIRVVENVGAGAYTYATQYLTNQYLLQTAATVATVEARHASFLNAAAGKGANQDPFPLAFEKGLNISTVLSKDVAGPFFTSCPKSAATVCFDGQTRSFSVLDHAPGNTYEPKLASSFRKTASGTFPAGQGPALSKEAYARDTIVLQFALTAENAENAFYKLALSNITEAAFVAYFTDANSPFNTTAGQPDAATVYKFLQEIAQHEQTHVDTLNTVISGRSTSGVPPCSYPSNFTLLGLDGTPAGLIKASTVFENTGVSAYLGAITLISDVNLVAAAASIALIEARHASFLQVLIKGAGLLPTPASGTTGQNYDVPADLSTVVNTLGLLLGTCPNIATADPNNTPSSYSSLTLPGFADLAALAKQTNKAGGYNDAQGYTGVPTSTSSTNNNGGASTSARSSASVAVASFALVGAAALLF